MKKIDWAFIIWLLTSVGYLVLGFCIGSMTH